MRTCSDGSDTFYTSSGNSPPILAAALDCVRQGFWLVPLKPGRKDPWRRPHGYQDLPAATEAEIRNWFAEEPSLNIGLLTGHGIIVIDVDEHDGKMSGAQALAALEAIYRPLPPTLTSITGSGGRHLIFRLPLGYDFGNRLPVISEWLRTTTGKATGGVIDVRGNGGLIVLPPSVHPNGTPYRWVDSTVPIATLPLVWCQTPESLTLTDPERRTRSGTQAPRTTIAPENLDALDVAARERLANVDPDALLGRDTLLLLANGDPDDSDRTHVMWRVIIGAARVHFDPDALWLRMLDSPLEDGLRDHGRDWFDARTIEAHRYIIEHSLNDEDVSRLRSRVEDLPSRVTFVGRNGKRQTIFSKNVRTAWYEVLHQSEKQETTAPMVGTLLLKQATGMHQDTARKALQAFECLGWASPEDVSTGRLTSAYRYHLCLTDPRPTGRSKSLRTESKKIDPGDWLTELLRSHGGTMRSVEIRARAAGIGIEKRTLRRHARRTGVKIIRTPQGTTEWRQEDYENFRLSFGGNARTLLNFDALPLDESSLVSDESSVTTDGSSVTNPSNNPLCLSVPIEVPVSDLDLEIQREPLTCLGTLVLQEDLTENSEATGATNPEIRDDDQLVLRDFSDPDVVSNADQYPQYESPEQPGSDWTQHRCKKCGGMTVSVRDAESRRIFRMDAEPAEFGNLVIVDERWKLPQVSTVTDSQTENQYLAHSCTPQPPEPEYQSPPTTPRRVISMSAPQPVSDEEVAASVARVRARINTRKPSPSKRLNVPQWPPSL